MLPWSDWVVPSAWDPGTKVKIPYTLHCPVSTPARCREHGTYGGQGKAVGCVPPTALLFEGAFLTSIKDADCDLVVGSCAAPCSNGRGVPPRMNLGHQKFGGLLLRRCPPPRCFILSPACPHSVGAVLTS